MKKQFLFTLMIVTLALSFCLCSYGEVKFLGKDTTTLGDWVGNYGNNGAILFALADQTDMKDITSFDDGGNNRWDWANPTDDPRGLISIDDPAQRLGTCMYNNPVGLLTLETSLNNYQVALCVIDWDSTVRIEDIVGFQGADAPETPDATVENPEFNQGIYYKWLVSGGEPFKLQITHMGGANWVISGLFVDEVSSSAVQANGKLASTWGEIRADR